MKLLVIMATIFLVTTTSIVNVKHVKGLLYSEVCSIITIEGKGAMTLHAVHAY